MASYGVFISTTPREVAAGGLIILDSILGSASGLTFTAGGATVRVTRAGVYTIDYRVNYTTGIGATIRFLHNDTVVCNSPVSALLTAGGVSSIAILTLAAGDTIAIGAADVAVTLAANTNAFLSITQIA